MRARPVRRQIDDLVDHRVVEPPELALAHHGSVAREKRREIEDRLKSGNLRSIVATSSLELGIDMGAVDLVIQIEAPVSIASGLQRIGRASHNVNGVSNGVIFPKHRGDLVACAAVVPDRRDGACATRHLPRRTDHERLMPGGNRFSHRGVCGSVSLGETNAPTSVHKMSRSISRGPPAPPVPKCRRGAPFMCGLAEFGSEAAVREGF